MNNLFIGPASARRSFVDNIANSYDVNHEQRLAEYDKLLKDRLKILNEAYYNNVDYDKYWLDILEKKIVQIGTAILCARHYIVDLLNYEGEQATGFSNFSLSLAGKYDELFDQGHSVEQIENEFLSDLQDVREKDAIVNRSFVGIHRSDLIVHNILNGLVVSNCSTGEQKYILISLVVAQIKVCSNLHSSSIIVLLDDIVSYLDHKVRGKLLTILQDLKCQFWITTTEEKDFADIIPDICLLKMHNGELVSEA